MHQSRSHWFIGLCFLIVGESVLGEDPSNGLHIQVQTITTGDTRWDWRQARTAVFPQKDGWAITTMSQTSPTGSHGYRDVFLSLTRNSGRTWSAPELIPSLRRTRQADGSDRVASDLWPLPHPQTNTILITGKIFVFEGGTRENHLREEVAYAAYDPAANQVGPLLTLQLPGTDHEGRPMTAANAGCTQAVCLANGDILLPIRYRKDPKKRLYTSTVARCAFDGQTLHYLKHGSEHTLMTGRGLGEPSLTEFQGRYFLTLRANDDGYVARSNDGLAFSEYRPWTFDNGEPLGSVNTQQHWLTVGGRLYLVYTRRGIQNDDVFRYRAPLLIGQVDPEKLCVLRSTERIVFPNDGGNYGNFGICQVSTEEAWITCAEDGAKRKTHSQTGNEVFLARIISHSSP